MKLCLNIKYKILIFYTNNYYLLNYRSMKNIYEKIHLFRFFKVKMNEEEKKKNAFTYIYICVIYFYLFILFVYRFSRN